MDYHVPFDQGHSDFLRWNELIFFFFFFFFWGGGGGGGGGGGRELTKSKGTMERTFSSPGMSQCVVSKNIGANATVFSN